MNRFRSLAYFAAILALTILTPNLIAQGGPRVCSTEKINGDCVVNIDRRFPIVMPTFPMRPKAHVTVNVYFPLHFETLTLDPGTATALQGTDQAAGLVSSASPLTKGVLNTHLSTERLAMAETESLQLEGFVDFVGRPGAPAPTDVEKQKALVASDLLALDTQIKLTFAPIQSFLDESEIFYAQVREIQSPIPRAQKAAAGADSNSAMHVDALAGYATPVRIGGVCDPKVDLPHSDDAIVVPHRLQASQNAVEPVVGFIAERGQCEASDSVRVRHRPSACPLANALRVEVFVFVDACCARKHAQPCIHVIDYLTCLVRK